jgi:hypothetical protein
MAERRRSDRHHVYLYAVESRKYARLPLPTPLRFSRRASNDLSAQNRQKFAPPSANVVQLTAPPKMFSKYRFNVEALREPVDR